MKTLKSKKPSIPSLATALPFPWNGPTWFGLILCQMLVGGCDYRWSDSDKPQTREVVLSRIGLPRPSPKNTQTLAAPTQATVDRGESDLQTLEKSSSWVSLDSLPIHHWDIIYLGNRPVGYTRRSIALATKKQLEGLFEGPAATISVLSTPLLSIEAESRIRISRKIGEPIDQTVSLNTIEKPSGELLGIIGSIDTGVTKRRFIGSVKDRTLSIEQTEDKVVSRTSVPWEASDRGPFAIEQSLRNDPMKPKQVRVLRYLDPFQMAVTESRLEALAQGPTVDFQGELMELVEIENRSVTQGRNANSLLWSDAQGVIRKSYTPGVDRQTFDCDPVTARYVISKEEFDASNFKELPLLGSFPSLPENGVALFRVASEFLRDDESISSRTNQQVSRVNEKTWDVQVSQTGSGVDGSTDPVDETMLASAGMIDWKDPAVKRWISAQKESIGDAGVLDKDEPSPMAKQAQQARRRALAARNWVTKTIDRTATDRNLQTPATTLRERKGDCIDQAILLTATLRSLGIPARVAVGFRAEPSTVRPTFQLHTWVEYNDSTRWLPIDSYIDTDAVPLDRIKITESSLPSLNAFESILRAVRLIPDIEITARTKKP
jgi:hypothetical protein